MELALYKRIYNILNNKHNIKVVKGNKKHLIEEIELLGDASIKVYGEDYKDLIDATMNDTIIYHCSDIEDVNRTVSEVFPELGNMDYKRNGLLICFGDEMHVFFEDKYQLNILAHELFVHAVSSRTKGVLDINNNKYDRIGFQYNSLNDGKIINKTLNEGFTVNYEDKIISNIDKNLIRSHSLYKYSSEVAREITDYVPEKIVTAAMLLGIPIYSLFSSDGAEVLKKISSDLDAEFYLSISRNGIEKDTFDECYDRITKRIDGNKKKLVYSMKH